MKKIIVGICTRGNDLYYETIKWLMTQVYIEGAITEVVFQPSPYSAAYGQEKLFKYANEKKADYLLIVDADVCPPDGCLQKMIDADKDIVVAPAWFYDHKNDDIHLNISYTGSIKVQERVYQNKLQGLEEIKAASFAVMLVKKRVIDKFVKSKELFTEWSSMLPKEYKKAFSDNIFFAKARKFGFKAYVLWEATGAIHYRMVKLCNKTLARLMKNCRIIIGKEELKSRYV